MKRRRFVLNAVLAIGFLCTGRASPPVPPRLKRTAVASTSLASVGYDPAQRLLEVEFRTGEIYRYMAVPQKVYEELISAESKGRYFSQRVRNRYRFHRVRQENQ